MTGLKSFDGASFGVQLMLSFVERTLIFSVKPKYAADIADGRKTVELRRRFGSDGAIGAFVLIYSSAPDKTIVATAEIADVHRLPIDQIWEQYADDAVIERSDFERYFSGLACGYVIVLDNIRKLEEPVTREKLERKFGFRPPQSYGYFPSSYRALAE